MPKFELKPQLTFQLENGIVKAQGLDYTYIEIILNTLISRAYFITDKKNNNYYAFMNVLVLLGEGKYDIIPIEMMPNFFRRERKFIIGNSVSENKIVIMVPVIKELGIYFPSRLSMFITSFPVILYSLFTITKILKFDSDRWSLFYMFQIFIGIATSAPKKLSEKVIFILLTGLSITYTNIILTALGQMKIVTYDQIFDSYQDLIESKMKIYTIFPVNEQHRNEIKEFLSLATRVNSTEHCLSELIKTRFVICITAYIKAKYSIRNHLDIDGLPIMKLAELTFNNQFTAFTYEKASPFAEKFDQIIQRIKESGLTRNQKVNETIQIHSS